MKLPHGSLVQEVSWIVGSESPGGGDAATAACSRTQLRSIRVRCRQVAGGVQLQLQLQLLRLCTGLLLSYQLSCFCRSRLRPQQPDLIKLIRTHLWQ